VHLIFLCRAVIECIYADDLQDLALKLQRQQVVPHQTRIYPENPWRLQQVS